MNNFSTAPTRKILDGLGQPDLKLKIIHIAGTNGKGSTAEFFTRILISAGKKVGTFTSPETYCFYDQFRLNGEPVTRELYEKYKAQAFEYADGASEFELQTATAISAFAGEGCEWAVLECGMGGLNDATNAILKKELAVITSISLEHTAYLGDTLESICEQKAGIIKNCPAIICAYQPPEVKNYFSSLKFADEKQRVGERLDAPSTSRFKQSKANAFAATRNQASVLSDFVISSEVQRSREIFAAITFADGVEQIFDGGFICDGRQFTLAARGSLQPYNAACAIAGARLLGIDEQAIYNGVKACVPCGRLQKFDLNGRTYILDGAHNPAAFEPLNAYIKTSTAKRSIIFGCLADKDIDGNLNGLYADEFIAVACPSVRTRSVDDIENHLKKHFKSVKRAESIAAALDNAEGEEIIVCGSFTLLKEAKQWIDKRQ